jgi:hypothetical protein
MQSPVQPTGACHPSHGEYQRAHHESASHESGHRAGKAQMAARGTRYPGSERECQQQERQESEPCREKPAPPGPAPIARVGLDKGGCLGSFGVYGCDACLEVGESEPTPCQLAHLDRYLGQECENSGNEDRPHEQRFDLASRPSHQLPSQQEDDERGASELV